MYIHNQAVVTSLYGLIVYNCNHRYIQAKDKPFYAEVNLDDGNPVLVYFHGNAYSR